MKLKQNNEKKKKLLVRFGVVIGVLVLIIILMELYSYTKQISKSNLNSTLTQAQGMHDLNVRIHELEERVEILEKSTSIKE